MHAARMKLAQMPERITLIGTGRRDDHIKGLRPGSVLVPPLKHG